MTVKTTGAEWNCFYNDESVWPKGAWHEGETILIDGKEYDYTTNAYGLENIHPASKVSLSGGVFYLKEDDTDGPSMEAYFKRWRKKKATTWFVCEVHKDLAEAVKMAIVAAGGKVR